MLKPERTQLEPLASSLRWALPGNGLLIDGAIAAAYFLLVGFWSIIIPLHGAPDELNQLFFVEYLHHFGSVPQPQVEPVQPYIGDLTGSKFDKTDVWYQGLPFAHVLGALAFAKLFAPVFPGHEYLAARLFNWVLGAVFVFSLIRALRTTGLESSIVRLIAVLIATIPQVTFIFAYFNHDAFGLAAVTLSLHAFLRLVNDPERGSNAVYFGACCGFILLAKPYHWPALVFFGLMLLLWWMEQKLSLQAIAIRAIPACLLVAAPILAWTYIEFGDVTGWRMWQYYLSVYPEITSAARNLCYVFCDNVFANWGELRGWVWQTFTSFFGNLGWLNLPLPAYIYLLWFVPLASFFGLLSAIFVSKWVRSVRSGGNRIATFDAGFVTLTSLMLLGTAVMSLVHSQTKAPQAQGRYLFVVLPFVAYCLALFAKNAEAKWAFTRKGGAQAKVVGGLAALAIGMLLVNLYAALFVVAPANLAWGGRKPYLSMSLTSHTLSIDYHVLATLLSEDGKALIISMPNAPGKVEGWVDGLSYGPGRTIDLSGWAFDKDRNEPAEVAVLFHHGAPIHIVKVNIYRPDVVKALNNPNASHSGFEARILTDVDFDLCAARVFAITRSLQTGELLRAKRICPK